MLAFNPIEPITKAMLGVIAFVHHYVPSYGLDMILLALLLRLSLWFLAAQQFKSMAEMQKLQPLMKSLQAKYKGNAQELQSRTMALYKEHNVNPLAGCLPMVIQLPVLLGLFYAINSQLDQFKTQGFLWIGSPLSLHYPQVFATSLAALDMPLFVLYIVSMYLTVRFGSPPSSDPQQAQTQKIMAFISPAMIAFFGFKYHWASALLIYWLALNAFTMAQQIFMYRRLGLMGGTPVPEPVLATGKPELGKPARLTIDGEAVAKGNGTNGKPRQTLAVSQNGSTSGRNARRRKRQ